MRFRARVQALFLPTLLLVGCGEGDATEMTSGAVYRVTPTSSGISAKMVAGGGFRGTLDAVPSSDGATFYFTASTLDGEPGVFRVDGEGGTATVLASGAPLVSALGIAISSDDRTLFVAEPSAGVFSLPAGGGTPALVAGTDCLEPRALDVRSEGGVDQLYIATGAGACGGGAGLAKVAAAGGAVSFLASGAPFKVPTGVAVASNGDVYVANPDGDGASTGNIVKVSGGNATELVAGIRFGHPAGIALDVAGTALFASGHDATGHDQVYAVTLSSSAIATYNSGIGDNTDGGGLHRAATRDVFAWADATVLRPPPIKPTF